MLGDEQAFSISKEAGDIIMLFGTKPVVGLDVGSSCVKAVQLRRVGKTGIQMDRFGVAEVFPSGDKTSAGAETHDLKVKAIKAALSQAGITTKQV
ncbi:hypothetical protein FJY63_06745, partial [Candidatus Sumerlaeota bacterium]|nr:hypothetical protein [Candidatus Sumerlaeota bacterium]